MALVLVITSCQDPMENPDPNTSPSIWNGSKITFEKPDGGDPALAENQDRISDEVWLTRGNVGGQIYNIVSEDSADQSTSPVGTLWAIGTTEELESLEFSNFRAAIGSPQSAVDKNLVLLLEDENIAIDLKFTKWSGGSKGGFAYERSTK